MFLTGNKNRNSFTLIELLVVLALVAILSVVVIITLNPAELIKQARDSNRLSDLSTINTALNLFSTDVTSGFMGTSTVVYVSIPDNASSTCGSLGLPVLPVGYVYNCVTAANLRNTDGTGWIPVNFQRISSNSPISQLPIDPINTTSTGNYYMYISGGSYEITSNMESAKQKSLTGAAGSDGGKSWNSYEIGNNLGLMPIGLLEWKRDSSLVGYWAFDEGPSAAAIDYSGNSYNGTWYGTSTQLQHYPVGRVGAYCGWFDGSGDYIQLLSSVGSTVGGGNAVTIAEWFKGSLVQSSVRLQSDASHYVIFGWGTSNPQFILSTDGGTSGVSMTSTTQDGNWHFLVGTWQRNAVNGFKVYLDGVVVNQKNSSDVSLPVVASNNYLGRFYAPGLELTSGSIDDVRIYNRALSSAEVSALYNATK